MTVANPWLVRPVPNPSADLRLFCFPYAGGGAAVFRGWAEGLGPEIEVCAVRLPGRESRLREAPFRQHQPLIEALLPALQPELNRRFALFGHSMGALIGFELARELARRGGPMPVHLFVSGHRAPNLPSRVPPLANLPEPEFRDRLRAMGGTPAEILDDPELMTIFGPLLRADLALGEGYAYRDAPPLGCPVSAFGGEDDPRLRPEDLQDWARQTRAPFTLKLFPGGHFFLHTAGPDLLQAIRMALRPLLSERGE